jgi:FtsP/CotA-like multicopper oxidase with cupredoxin domain
LHERGWKDTLVVYPGQVTRILVRYAPTDLPLRTRASRLCYPFDPNGGIGYVLHCHILDHEDNEMMRPNFVLLNPNAPAAPVRPLLRGRDY